MTYCALILHKAITSGLVAEAQKREETPVGRVCRVHNAVKKLQFHLWRENSISYLRDGTLLSENKISKYREQTF